MNNDIWTVARLLQWGTDHFQQKGIESPRLNIELLLCHVLSCRRLDLYIGHERPLIPSELSVLRSFVLRRSQREPLQYILGTTEFLNCTIHVSKSVLIPRPETEELTNLVIDHCKKREVSTILDIGTGSGCIAIAIAKELPKISMTALDMDESAIVIAKENALRNGVVSIDFLISDIFQYLPDHTFDVVISNPPYIDIHQLELCEPEVRLFEPRSALTDGGDGLKFYRHFSKHFDQLVSPNGLMALEVGHDQAEAVEEMFLDKRETKRIKDLSGKDRIVLITSC